LPISFTSRIASFSLFSFNNDAALRRISPLFGAGVSFQEGRACSAALTASSTSAAVAD